MVNILKSGFFTTVQDAGRFGYRDRGVPVSGVMDAFSAFQVNTLLENGRMEAVLEITMTGPTLEFQEDTYIAFGGADMLATINNEEVQAYKVYKINRGDVLAFGKLQKGFRVYLGIKDGFKTDLVLGSRSYYRPLTETDSIKTGSILPYSPCRNFEPKISKMKLDTVLDNMALEVYRGPEFDQLTDRQLGQLFSSKFPIAKENNRMAYQLNDGIGGMAGNNGSMLTSATLPGTVQLTPSGKLIVLMKDGQTTGGYPRILQLSDHAISILAQKRSGDPILFTLKQGE